MITRTSLYLSQKLHDTRTVLERLPWLFRSPSACSRATKLAVGTKSTLLFIQCRLLVLVIVEDVRVPLHFWLHLCWLYVTFRSFLPPWLIASFAARRKTERSVAQRRRANAIVADVFASATMPLP